MTEFASLALAAFLLVQATPPLGQPAFWLMIDGCPTSVKCGKYYLPKPMTLLECSAAMAQLRHSRRVIRSGCSPIEPKWLPIFNPEDPGA